MQCDTASLLSSCIIIKLMEETQDLDQNNKQEQQQQQ